MLPENNDLTFDKDDEDVSFDAMLLTDDLVDDDDDSLLAMLSIPDGLPAAAADEDDDGGFEEVNLLAMLSTEDDFADGV